MSLMGLLQADPINAYLASLAQHVAMLRGVNWSTPTSGSSENAPADIGPIADRQLSIR